MKTTFQDAKTFLMYVDVIIASDMNEKVRFLQVERGLSNDDADKLYLIDTTRSKKTDYLFIFPAEHNTEVKVSDRDEIILIAEDGKVWFLEACMRVKVTI